MEKISLRYFITVLAIILLLNPIVISTPIKTSDQTDYTSHLNLQTTDDKILQAMNLIN